VKVVLDTNIYIDWLNRGRHADLMLGGGMVRYLSGVVEMELTVGATTRAARRALDQLVKTYDAANRRIGLSAASFSQAGKIIQKLRRQGIEVRRASLVNDVFISVSARSIGATVVTANASDFEAIGRVHQFSLRVIAP
jgi:predicted nucleic acid-binding protein